MDSSSKNIIERPSRSFFINGLEDDLRTFWTIKSFGNLSIYKRSSEVFFHIKKPTAAFLNGTNN